MSIDISYRQVYVNSVESQWSNMKCFQSDCNFSTLYRVKYFLYFSQWKPKFIKVQVSFQNLFNSSLMLTNEYTNIFPFENWNSIPFVYLLV